MKNTFVFLALLTLAGSQPVLGAIGCTLSNPAEDLKYLYPEIFGWFRENRFTRVEIYDGPIRMCGVKV